MKGIKNFQVDAAVGMILWAALIYTSMQAVANWASMFWMTE